MPKLKLTQHAIKTQCLPPRPDELTRSGTPVLQHVYFDEEVTSFALVVRRPQGGEVNATFMVIRSVRGRTVKQKVARYGELTVDQARKRAREIIVEMEKNPAEAPVAPPPVKVTVADALARHATGMQKRGCSPRSIKMVQDETSRHLVSWLTTPLDEITGEMCDDRHTEITKKSGKYIANRVMRHLRAAYATARAANKTLPPESPTDAVQWNKQYASEKKVLWAEMPNWWAKVHAIPNPVRRDLQLFILFTGLRSTDARTVRWSEVDLEAGTVHRPCPKGGKDRAFTLPLSRVALSLLRRRESENRVLFTGGAGDHGWVFPARLTGEKIGAVQVVRESRYVRGSKGKKKEALVPSPHALRRTFATAAGEAGVDWLTIKLLLNHAKPSQDVTASYVQPSTEHVRAAAEQVAAFLLAKAGQPPTPETKPRAV
jgi:integrase